MFLSSHSGSIIGTVAQLHSAGTFIPRDPCCSVHSTVHHSEKYFFMMYSRTLLPYLQIQMQAKIIVDLSF